MSQAGWNGKGRVAKVWRQLIPPTRDRLAELCGVRPTELSRRNSGDIGLTYDFADRIIAGAAKAGVHVTYAELGAPPETAEVLRILSDLERRLVAVEAEFAQSEPFLDVLGALAERVDVLERHVQPGTRRVDRP
jgi:transcriptional regulator with XRE-family HTH domain